MTLNLASFNTGNQWIICNFHPFIVFTLLYGETTFGGLCYTGRRHASRAIYGESKFYDYSMHFFPCEERKFQKIFNGIFSSWLQSFSSSHLSQWNWNKAKSLIHYNDWIQTVENIDKPLNEWMNEKNVEEKQVP